VINNKKNLSYPIGIKLSKWTSPLRVSS